MTETPQEIVIQQLAKSASTPFGTLNRAKVVAQAMPLLEQLRNEHKQPWKALADLFNAAMARVEGKFVTPESLCRLYNTERQRRRLLEHTANADKILTVGDMLPAAMFGPDAQSKTSLARVEVETSSPRHGSATELPLLRDETFANLVRDGPRPPSQLPNLEKGSENEASQVMSRLAEARKFQELRNKSKKNVGRN